MSTVFTPKDRKNRMSPISPRSFLTLINILFMGIAMSIIIVNWNVRWARPSNDNGKRIASRIAPHNPDIVCLTEVDAEFFNGCGHTIVSGADYGYSSPPWKRKVLLWSRLPWRSVDVVGDIDLPTGRFIAAETETSIGIVRCVGVCIPWSGAHVTTGRKDRRLWEDHACYLEGLQRVIDRLVPPAIILGDFNQTLPRTRAPRRVHDLLCRAMADRVQTVTAGILMPKGKLTIDHVAVTPGLIATNVRTIDNLNLDGKPLSDHFGIVVKLNRS